MAIGAYRHLVTFQDPGPPVPDGEGGYTEGWTDLAPTWRVSITPATVRDLERVGAGTILASATHVIKGRWRADLTLETRMLFEGRIFHLTNITNDEERDWTMTLLAEEQL
jgi:head-tail adaptor